MPKRLLIIVALLVAASCSGKKKKSNDGPNLARKPPGSGWWCMNSSDASISCRRTQHNCETDRARVLSRMPEGTTLPRCTEHKQASCLTFRPRDKGNETSFCRATPEDCESTRKQLHETGKTVGHTRITRCAPWD